MIKGKTILAIIPARGGSKGLPGKNIKEIAGKPLIAWSIEQGIKSKYIDKLIVSTDDKEIANMSKKYGAELPFIRPQKLAEDSSATIDVVLHAISYFEEKLEKYELVVLLEPTSPLREVADIDKAIEMLMDNKEAESIVGVAKVEDAHPAFLISLENQFLRPYLYEDFKVIRRQELNDLYFYEGSIYISYTSSLKARKNFYHRKAIGFEFPKWKAFEVDDKIDFLVIESLLIAREKGVIK